MSARIYATFSVTASYVLKGESGGVTASSYSGSLVLMANILQKSSLFHDKQRSHTSIVNMLALLRVRFNWGVQLKADGANFKQVLIDTGK